MMIVLDPGHGGAPDPGAVGPTGLRECDVAYDVCERLASLLGGGHEVHLTRGARDGPSLAERVARHVRLHAVRIPLPRDPLFLSDDNSSGSREGNGRRGPNLGTQGPVRTLDRGDGSDLWTLPWTCAA